MRELDASPTVPNDSRPEQLASPAGSLPKAAPSAERAVVLDDVGAVVAVGLPEPSPPQPIAYRLEEDLGPLRDAFGRTKGITPAEQPGAGVAEEGVDAVLSAQAPAEIYAGEEGVIDVRVELADGATPLARAVAASISPEEPLVAILSIADSGVLEAPYGRIIHLAAPSAGKPTVNAMVVRGLAEGRTSVVILFRQGGSDLGQLALHVAVVADKTTEASIEATVVAEGRDVLDDQVVALLIEEDVVGDQIRYRCLVTADAFGLENAEFASEFVKAGAGTTTSAWLAVT